MKNNTIHYKILESEVTDIKDIDEIINNDEDSENNSEEIDIDYNVNEKYQKSLEKQLNEDIKKTTNDFYALNKIEEDKGLFGRFINIFKKNKKQEPIVKESIIVKNCNTVFDDILDEINPEDENYNNCEKASLLCTESLDLANKKINYLIKLQENKKRENELQFVGEFNDIELEELTVLCEQYEVLEDENKALFNKMTSFKESVSIMEGKEKEVEEVIPSIQHAEKKYRLLQADINLIEGEKQETIEELNVLETAMTVLERATFFLLSSFGVGTLFIGYLISSEGMELVTLLFAYDAIVLSGIIIIYYFYKKTKFEKKLAHKKQNKLIELQNKKKTVLAFYKNFLDFEYSKYKERNADRIKSNLEEYNNYKSVQNRKKAVKRSLNEIEKRIIDIFVAKEIEMPNIEIKEIGKNLDKIEVNSKLLNLQNEEKRIEESLEKIEEELSYKWTVIQELNETDTSQKGIISQIVKAYHGKSERIMRKYNKSIDENS